MVDGVAAGIWGLERRGRRVEVEVEMFRPLTASEKGLIKEEAEDIGRFLGATATVKF